MNADRPDIRVYYNSACPVCNAGIEARQARMAGCPVAWNDVHADHRRVEEIATRPDLEFVRERLHVVDEDGRVHVGLDAFLAIWARSPGEAWKARILGQPGVRPLAGLGYNLFAAILYRCNRLLNHW